MSTISHAPRIINKVSLVNLSYDSADASVSRFKAPPLVPNFHRYSKHYLPRRLESVQQCSTYTRLFRTILARCLPAPCSAYSARVSHTLIHPHYLDGSCVRVTLWAGVLDFSTRSLAPPFSEVLSLFLTPHPFSLVIRSSSQPASTQTYNHVGLCANHPCCLLYLKLYYTLCVTARR